jgi:hypothetical protein
MPTNSSGFGDDQGTRVGAPDQEKTSAPAQHNDSPPNRREQSTSIGNEALVHDKDSSEHDREHRSGYGGKGGSPDTSSDDRQ